MHIEFREKCFAKKGGPVINNKGIENYEKAYRYLKKWTECKVLHEQDTIERLYLYCETLAGKLMI